MSIARHAKAIVVTLILSVVVTLLGLNLAGGDKKVDVRPTHLYGVDDAQFVRSMGVLLGPQLVAGNRVDTLVNGDQIFPAMLSAIEGARRTITFESYIYWSGEVGRRFAEALAARARAGVKAHVLIDWVGSQKMDESLLETMRAAGVRVEKYRPLHWYTLARLNNRTHRKLLVIDGRTGFTGGVGIADEWSGNAQDPDHWRDNHYRLVGPTVSQMQATFMDNWTRQTGQVLHGDEYFPRIEPAGDQYAQIFASSSEGGAESMHLMYLLSIAAAQRSIDLAMAYFVPDAVATEALVAAMRRGVRVRLILPNRHTDADAVRSASRSTWGPLLEAGALIHEYQPTMYHCKLMVVDGLWSAVGSTNFDNRSFRLNDEANLNVYDPVFARRQVELFEADLAKSRRVTLEQWRARPWHERLWERAMGLLAPQL